MKHLSLALLLASCIAAHAASPEADYLAARDRDIATLAKSEATRDTSHGDVQLEKALADLAKRMKPIIGRVAVVGFPTKSKLNLETLSTQDEGFGMLDGLAFGVSESDKSLVVSTPGLLDAWLAAHRKTTPSDPDVPRDPAAAVKTDIFYTWAMSTGSAVVHYAELPVVAPPDATFAHATLSARTQDQSPQAPDEIFVALEHRGRVFLVEAKLATPMKPIAACDAITKETAKRADAADKAYAAGPATDAPDPGVELRDKGDAAFRACYGEKITGSAAFKAATTQGAAIIAALVAARRD